MAHQSQAKPFTNAAHAARHSAPCVELVEGIRRACHLRQELLDEELFSDPAWDIMLQLYSAELIEQRLPAAMLRVDAALPATTTRDYLILLEAKGLVVRRTDPLDHRRIFALLTRNARHSMDTFVQAIAA